MLVQRALPLPAPRCVLNRTVPNSAVIRNREGRAEPGIALAPPQRDPIHASVVIGKSSGKVIQNKRNYRFSSAFRLP